MGSGEDRRCRVTDFADDLWIGYVGLGGDAARYLNRGIDGCAVEIDGGGILVGAVARASVGGTRRAGHDGVDHTGWAHDDGVTDAPFEAVCTPHDWKLIGDVDDDVAGG